ncbi:titin-like isoform X2 [Mytilus californianus]|uniref:titin-like isoform X2 n=1 Tax=Mytilus californianus TaxID=6549 RepID=UPI002248273D|nr:titin-like isoform X2 [Mytilus californianus]
MAERSRSKHKVRSPRMKASHIQYAPEGRRGNVYIDEEGRRIYRTSGKSGHSKRYVVMDDGELKRGERPEKIEYQQEETEYETLSEADSEYMVPVRPKGQNTSTRRVVEGRPRVLTRRAIAEDERPVLRTRDGDTMRSTRVSRSRPASDYVVRRNDTLNNREELFVRSGRPASEVLVRPSRERVVTRRVVDDSNLRERYVVRSRPSSEKRIIDNRDVELVRRPRSEERVTYVKRPVSEETNVKYVTRNSFRDRQPIGYVTKEQVAEERALKRQEYIDYPQEYIIQRPPTRDVGCQMTTNYVIQPQPKQRKLLRNVQTQTFKKPKQRKIKTYYQRETVEVVNEPDPPTPREPTPRTPTPPPPPPPRILTPEPPRQPKPPKKKKPKKEKEMQLVVKQPNLPEPVYDRVEDLEVVAGSSKIYYEAPKKKEHLIKNPEPDPPRYAYYEPSEYTASKKIVSTEKDITAESTSSSRSSSNNERVKTADNFYTVPLTGSTTFYGPFFKKENTYPPKRKSSKNRKKRKQTTTYERPRYVETAKRQRKKHPHVAKWSRKTSEDSAPPQVETYLKKVPVLIHDYGNIPRSSLKQSGTHSKKKTRGHVQIEEYGAKLSHGPSFYMNDSKNGKLKSSGDYSTHSTLLYVNPETENVEPLKYTGEIETQIKDKRKWNEQEEEPRYVVIPGFDDHSKPKIKDVIDNTAKHFDDDPLVIVEDSKFPNRRKLSLKSQSDMDDTYLTPISHGQHTDKWLKGKAHMVRVGGGWMKVEHHRNHHTPLKIYEIPRDANDDKFLYIKSRFNPNRKEVPIAYKKYREEIVRG